MVTAGDLEAHVPLPPHRIAEAELTALETAATGECIAAVKRLRAAAGERIRAGIFAAAGAPDGSAVAAELTATVDALVGALWRRCLARGDADALGAHMGLFALGGYGRTELAPGSDLDLLILRLGRAAPADAVEIATGFQTLLWDCGFKVGAALRSRDELEAILRHDFVTGTALIEARRLAATGAQVEAVVELLEGLRRKRRRPFLRHKTAELAERRRNAGDSPFLLEPDCKNSPGCLRDVQFLHAAGFAIGGVRDLEPLRDIGGLHPADLSAVAETNRHLLLLRALQHFHHGKRGDVLRLPDQQRLAEQLGYVDATPLRGVEQMMRDLFGRLDRVQQTVRVLRARLDALGHTGRRHNLLRTRKRLLPGYTLIAGEVYVSREHPWPLARLASELFTVCRRAQRRGARLSVDLQHRIRTGLRRLPPEHRSDPELAGTFRAILGEPGRAHPILADMHASGLLGYYLPEFRRITHLMQFNAHHHYTIDEHTLLAVRTLDELYNEGDVGDAELRTIARRIANRNLLVLAVLLHDLGKYLGDNHVERGALMIPHVAERLHLAPGERDLVHFLVGHHLLLSRATRRRDIHDHALLTQLAEEIATPERLDALYLLTWADAAAVGPGRFMAWERELLRELHRALHAVLAGHLPGDRGDARDRVLARLTAAGVDAAAAEAHLDRLPDAYPLQVNPDTLVPCYQCLAAARGDPDRHAWRSLELEASTILVVAAPDRPGLLADVAAVLAAHGLDIIDGRTWETVDGLGVDAIRIHPLFPQRWAEERARDRFAADLRRCARNEIDAAACIRHRERTVYRRRRPDAGSEAIDIRSDDDSVATATVIDVHTREFPGMLSVLARTIAARDLDIAYASINTLEEMAVDTFYVSSGGERLPPDQVAALTDDLRAAIGREREA